MANCKTAGCKRPAMGWGVLKEGGASTIQTCSDHTPAEVLERFKLPEKKAAGAPAVKSTKPEEGK